MTLSLTSFLPENPFPCGMILFHSGAILPTIGHFHKLVSMTGILPLLTQTESPEICLKMQINCKDAKTMGGRDPFCLEPASGSQTVLRSGLNAVTMFAGTLET